MSLRKLVDLPVLTVDHKLVLDGYTGDPGMSVVRDDTKQIITNVSSRYELIRHSDVLDVIESVLDMRGTKYALTSVNMTGKLGTTMHAFYQLDEVFEPVLGDKMNPLVEVSNSYDTLTQLYMAVGTYRLVCSNGAMAYVKELQFQRMHINEGVKIRRLFLKLDKMLDSLKIGMSHSFNEMLNSPSSVGDVFSSERIKKFFPTKSLYEDFQLSGVVFSNYKEIGNNKYALFNSITEFASHHVENPEHKHLLQSSAIAFCTELCHRN